MNVKRYTFYELAKRECAECTTTITTIKVDRYVLATDYDLLEDERDGLLDELEKWVKKHDALKEQRDFAVRELKAILFMLQREKGKEGK